MATAPPRPCRVPTCPALVTEAMPCPTHGRPRTGRGSTRQWRARRLSVLDANPFCATCARAGRIRLAHQVDHVQPVHRGGTDADENLASICDACHAVKSREESRRA